MKFIFRLFLLLSPTLLPGQKLIESNEWCSNKHQPSSTLTFAGNNNVDPVDLLHANIRLDLSQASSKIISGSCQWTFKPQASGFANLTLDLLTLQVDSVQFNATTAAFTRQGEKLVISLSPIPDSGSVNTVDIFYHGTPEMDASGWGGFYFSGDYAFNLGVGFDADPHVYGRAWFPCIDDFTKRSTYNFEILTDPSQPAYCNGNLWIDNITNDGKRMRIWSLDNKIPSYLACVAIGPYTSYKRIYPGETGFIPVEIAAAAADTNKVRNTFQHLPQAIEAFEHWYGPFQWQKIGFSLVPFNSGAMEHATNVAIGRAYINGTLNYETLWAHELSHHWWGDLATCSTPEDMWLNEGWATYSEHLFTEWVYGRKAYINAVESNFLDVLQKAHVEEGGYLALSSIPHNITYGKHVYNKGAVVAHNLRGYMGENLFRQGIREALAATSFKDWSSADLRDKLESATSLDLHDFFDGWVFSGGYPDFLIDSVIWSPGTNGMHATLHVKQKLRGAPQFFKKIPLKFYFYTPTGERIVKQEYVSGEESVVDFGEVLPPFDISSGHFWLNADLDILQARSDGWKMLTSTGASNFADAKFNLTVNNLGADSVLFRVEHHFSAPDNAGANPNNYTLTNRFWEIIGNFPAEFNAQAIILYDGRGQMDQMDTELFDTPGATEDSVLLLYRPGAGHPWQEWPTYTQSYLGVSTDGFGQLKPTNLQAGQYTIGLGTSISAVKSPGKALGKVNAAPNPTFDKVSITSKKPFDLIQVQNVRGDTVLNVAVEKLTEYEISLKALPVGQYWIHLTGKTGTAITPVIKF
ncbi:MAG: M1 family metallopeptidase [Saprospiraceae bacterium]